MGRETVSRGPLASWDATSGQWLGADGMSGDLFGPSVPFSGRWPASGSMRNGQCYQRPTPDPAIFASASSSSPGLLPTPTAREKGGANCRHGDPGRGDDLPEAVKYLPTPNASDGKGTSQPEGRERSGRSRKPGDADLPEAVALLRTPTAQLASNGGSQHPDKRKAGGHGPTLADELEHLLPTPNATHERKTSRTGPLLHGIEMLLPTPRATDGTKGGPNQRGSSGDLMLPSAVMELLPTPMAADGDRASTVFPRGNPTLAGALLPTPSVADATGGHKTRGGDRSGEPLLGGIAMLLPTPTAMDSHGSRNATANRRADSTGHPGTTLSDVFWTGGRTDPPSADGKPSSATPPPGQLSLDGQGSA